MCWRNIVNTQNWINAQGQNLSGQTVLLTGASGGIGFEIACHLLNLNANLIITKRANGKPLTKQNLLNRFPNANIMEFNLDLSSLASVDEFVDVINKQNISINHIINNAGIYRVPKQVTAENLDKHFVTNYLAPMYLSLKLLPVLNKTKNAKIVFQSSVAYTYCKINWQDPQSLNESNLTKLYARSKRLINLTVLALNKEFNEKYPNVTFSLAQPGVCATDITSKGFSKAISWLSKHFLKTFSHSASTGALGAVVALWQPYVYGKWLAPKGLFQVWGKPKHKRLKKCVLNLSEQQQAINLLFATLTSQNKNF